MMRFQVSITTLPKTLRVIRIEAETSCDAVIAAMQHAECRAIFDAARVKPSTGISISVLKKEEMKREVAGV